MRSMLALVLLSACGFSVGASGVDSSTDTISPDTVKVTWAVDATSGKPIPANAVEWADFLKAKGLTSIAVPSGVWSLQESSGALADSIGTVALAPGAPPPSYAVTVPGWSRHAVATADGAIGGFGSTNSDLPNLDTLSMTTLVLVQMPGAAPGAQRTFLVQGAMSLASLVRAELDTAKHVVAVNNSNNASAVASIGTAPAGVMLKHDVMHNQQRVITRAEVVALPFSALGRQHGLFIGGVVSLSPEARYLYLVSWYGPKAEITDTDAKALLDALDW